MDDLDTRWLSDRSRLGYEVRAAAERISRRRMFSELSPAERDDLVGTTIARYYDRWGPRGRADNVEAYLARTMYRALMDLYRERKQLPVRPVEDDSVDNALDRLLAPAPSLSSPVVGRAMADAFLAALDPDDARLLWLKAEGYSSREIGEFLGLRANAVDVRVHRLRRRLRELVDPESGLVD